MSAEEVSSAKESRSVEETHVQEGQVPSELPQNSDIKNGASGTSEQTNGESSPNPELATDDTKAVSGPEPMVHVSAHERDRKEQASRRVQEAQKYNNRDKGGRGGQRGGRGGYRNNNRFDPSKQEKTDDPVAIRKQVMILM